MIDKEKNIIGHVLAIIMVVLILTSCGNSEVIQSGNDNSNGNSSAEEVSQSGEAETPTLVINDLPDATDSASSSDGRPELGFALGDPNLKATDPSTVSLASGQIQVIEFFAFW